jgi:gluconolactonase
MTILVDSFTGKKLNSPNDVVVKSDGTIYFTDPPSGIHPSQQELPIQGVYRLHPDRSEMTLVASDFALPNGLAFSPDETRLYIDDSSRCHIRVFDVLSNGMLTNGRLFHTMKSRAPDVPDGMKVDVHGNVYCTGPGGVWVFDADGHHLGTIRIPEQATNCAWGGDDLQTLYITTRTSVYRMRTITVGIS